MATATRNGNGRTRNHTAAVANLASLIDQIEALEGTLTPDVAATGTKIERAVDRVIELYGTVPLDAPEGRAAIRAALLWDFERETV